MAKYHRQLITAAQNLTTSFVDLGGEIDCQDYKYLVVWLTIDINNSVNPRIKIVGKHTSGGTEEYKYDHTLVNCPASAVSAAAGTEESYIELDNDQDDLVMMRVPLDYCIPYVQVQISTGTVGATAGQIDAAYYTLGR